MDLISTGVGLLSSLFGGGGGGASSPNYDGGASLVSTAIGSPRSQSFRIVGDFNVGPGSNASGGTEGSGSAGINWEVLVPVAGVALLAFAIFYKRR